MACLVSATENLFIDLFKIVLKGYYFPFSNIFLRLGQHFPDFRAVFQNKIFQVILAKRD
jgi:hypothetical protein